MSLAYFNRLNYTLANEDTSLELGLLPDSTSHLMSVAGSGGRVLPLLAKKPQKVSCVDLVQEQLYVTELRIESLRALSHSEFLAFWGYPPYPAEPKQRKQLFQKIQLSAKAREFLAGLYESIEWDTILYCGKWERTMAKLSFINRRLTGLSGIGLFSNLTANEHFRYLKNRFPSHAWAITLTLLGNASVFNSLLYKGHFPKKNIPESNFRFYQGAFDRLFSQGPARKNFLLQILFFGKILFAEGNPVECDPEVFQQAKAGLEQAEVRYICGNIVEECAKSTVPVSVLSLSDVPSYFSGKTERRFMQEIRMGMVPEGLVVIRNYLRIPENTDLTGFHRVTSRYGDLIRQEKVQMYHIDVFQKTATEV